MTMNQQTQFLQAVALRTPYAFSETGDVATETSPAYPPPPSFSVNELLPALRSERAKVGWLGVGLGLGLAGGGYVLFRLLTQNDRLRRARYSRK